jgi:hypothetical protein
MSQKIIEVKPRDWPITPFLTFYNQPCILLFLPMPIDAHAFLGDDEPPRKDMKKLRARAYDDWESAIAGEGSIGCAVEPTIRTPTKANRS